jgi:hypothetical protein
MHACSELRVCLVELHLILILYGSLGEVILFYSLAENFQIRMENHFIESGEATFLSSQPPSSF